MGISIKLSELNWLIFGYIAYEIMIETAFPYLIQMFCNSSFDSLDSFCKTNALSGVVIVKWSDNEI